MTKNELIKKIQEICSNAIESMVEFSDDHELTNIEMEQVIVDELVLPLDGLQESANS